MRLRRITRSGSGLAAFVADDHERVLGRELAGPRLAVLDLETDAKVVAVQLINGQAGRRPRFDHVHGLGLRRGIELELSVSAGTPDFQADVVAVDFQLADRL